MRNARAHAEGGREFLTFVDDARVELDGDGVADDVAQEARGVGAPFLGYVAVLHGGLWCDDGVGEVVVMMSCG